MRPYFVNEAFNSGLEDYLKSKDKPNSTLFNSFLVVVIRMLISIYGELDIVNPFKIRNEEALDNNLMKYGAKKEDIDYFKRLLDGFYVIDKRNIESVRKEENIYFIEVQKKLIDLYDLKRKKVNISDEESKDFFDLLYTPGTSSPLRMSYNFLNADNIYEVAEYYREVMSKPVERNQKEEKDLLGFDIYKFFNLSISDLSKMNKKEVDDLNKQIYKSLDIKDNTINKEFLLEEKIRELKLQNAKITTGNGYVDILLIMSIIVTVVMVVVIFATLVF